MLASAINTIRPLIPNHSLRLPTTSNAPVPVYSRTKKPCCGAPEAGAVSSTPVGGELVGSIFDLDGVLNVLLVLNNVVLHVVLDVLPMLGHVATSLP